MLLIQNYVEGLSECLQELLQQNVAEIADIIFTAYQGNKQVFIMGNGGSASTASHFARDLSIGTAVAGKARIKAVSLTDNVVLVTALANDIDYGSIFEEQLMGRVSPGDVVIGITASGNSPNILKAIGFARKEGAITIGFVGFGGGKLKELAHKCIIFSRQNYGIVEDVHLCLAHIVSYLIKEKIVNAA